MCPLFIALTLVGADAASLGTEEASRASEDLVCADLKTLIRQFYDMDRSLLQGQGPLRERTLSVMEEYPELDPAAKSIASWIKAGTMGLSPINENRGRSQIVRVLPVEDSEFEFQTGNRGKTSRSPLFFKKNYLVSDLELDSLLLYRSPNGMLYVLATLENATGETVKLRAVDEIMLKDEDRQAVIARGRSAEFPEPVILSANPFPYFEGDRPTTFHGYYGTQEGHPYLCFLLFVLPPGTYDPELDCSSVFHLDCAYVLDYS